MGIDGAEIKRRRELAERKTSQPVPAAPTDALPKSSPALIKKIWGLFGTGLFILVLISIAFEAMEDSPTTIRPTTYTPSVTKYSAPVREETRSSSGYAENVTILLNSMYGNVCRAELNGWFSKTLKIDWTGQTNKFHALKILAEVGSVKEKLYADGVRYFQYPNDAGTYNVIDWETGEKESISDRALYSFSKNL